MPSTYRYARILASSQKHSEDRAKVIEHGESLVVVVADGAGGMRGGAAASDAVITAVTRSSAGFDITDPTIWYRVLTDVDHELTKTMAGETTAVIAVLGSDGILGASVGDSQAWLVTETGIADLTVGQSKKRLGSGRAVPVSFSRPRFEGTLVVGTDGLFNYAAMEKIASVVRGRGPADAADELRALVQLPSGRYQDDLSIIVIAAATTGQDEDHQRPPVAAKATHRVLTADASQPRG